MKFSIAERRDMVTKDGVCSIREQCEMVSIHRSGFYYVPQGVSELNLDLILLIEGYFL
jgi:putative transposase